MSEAKYWLHLEFAISGEFKGLPEKRLRGLWCDGIIPDQYLLNDETPRITGQAWIQNGRRGGEKWKFTLFLKRRVRSRSEINWLALLPAAAVTCWLGIDAFRKYLEIDPSAAVPDLA